MKFSESLKKNKDFQTVYRQGKSYANKYLVLYIMENQTEKNRIGISVSKKVGNSVVRHHLTRLISYAVQKGRERAAEDPRNYFIDDENSVDLFLGYAVAARRLKAQLAEQDVTVDDEHPLLVYIPCGVGGAPGGICFGLKQEFGDAAHVYFAEPVEAPCMLLGLASGLQNAICVQDIGLTGRTAADGLAVSRPSGFVGETVKAIVSGGFTVSDEHLFTDLHALHETERLFVEPSACAGFAGAVELSKMTDYLESSGLGAHWENAAHIVWATGGALVPEGEREKYLAN